MTFKTLIRQLSIVTAVIASLTAATGCSHDDLDIIDKGNAQTAVLTLRINLNNPDMASVAHSRATGDEYEPDKLPASNGEKMHTVRIIIADADGFVEHNTLWDLTTAPDIVATGQDFEVKSNELKTIILIANEDGTMVNDPVTGNAISAGTYFRTFDASIGVRINESELESLIFTAADNADQATNTTLRLPLTMSAIHHYFIGNDSEHYNATFTIHRAAVKYTYRIKNNDSKPHTVTSIGINNVASRQYFFPQATFTDDTQMFWDSYNTPDTSGREVFFDTATELAPGDETELGPFYLPEGHVTTAGNEYATAFVFDDVSTGWNIINWSTPQTPSQTAPMNDLPRNTHVIVNVNLRTSDITINYTVCPWVTNNIIIPPFN